MKRTIPVINGLRGIAIIGVIYHHILSHVTHAGWHAFTIGGVRIFPFTLLSNGSHGVDLFFILSGFVLFLPYGEGRRSMLSIPDALSFYLRRTLRLFPVLIGTTLLAIVLRYGFVWSKIWVLFGETMSYTLMPFPIKETEYYPAMNWVLWSLRVEIWFSILFPVLVIGMKRFGATIMVLSAIALDTMIRQWWYPDWTAARLFFFDSFPVRLDAFVLGMALVIMIRDEKKVFEKRWPLWAGIGLVLSGFWVSDINILDGVSNALCILYPPRILLISIGLTMLTGSLIVRKSWLASLVSSRPLQITGIMCYSIYVLHAILLMSINPRKGVLAATAYFVTLALFSLVSFLTLEKGSFARLLPDAPPAEPGSRTAKKKYRSTTEDSEIEPRVGAFFVSDKALG